jgi:hypothetical protein
MKSKNTYSNFFRPLPGTTFLIVAVIFLILPFFRLGGTADIHLHDTMFVVSPKIICYFLAILCGIEFLIYRFLNFLMFKTTLSWLQVFLTLLSFGLVLFSIYLSQFNQPPHDYSSENWKTFSKRNNTFAILTGGSFLLSLVILVVNITIGIFRKISAKK